MSDISEQIPWCPEFRPSEEEFRDFNAYIKACCSKIGSVGIFKVRTSEGGFIDPKGLIIVFVQVIPPEKWKARANGYDNIQF